MSVFIQKSKTDIYRDGNRIIIARTGNNLCPVNNLELYLQWVGYNHEFDFYLFRNLTKVNDHYIFRKENVQLCYTRMRELFIQAFKRSSVILNPMVVIAFGLVELQQHVISVFLIDFSIAMVDGDPKTPKTVM